MAMLRRDVLKRFCGATLAGLWGSIFGWPGGAIAGSAGRRALDGLRRRTHGPTYRIARDVFTTVERTVVPTAVPQGAKVLLPRQVARYAAQRYGRWDGEGPGLPFVRLDLRTSASAPSVPDPDAKTLASFFTISDVHVVDKESPAQVIYAGYEYPQPLTPDGQPAGNSSAYSAVILYSTHVLDAAVQTINALHRTAPFDFGVALGDAANNTQYNELRWYIDVLDGKPITPSSGAHRGARRVDYQKPYRAAGLDTSIPWYQAIGNHDQFWMGSTAVTEALRQVYVGSQVLEVGAITSVPPNWSEMFSGHEFYVGTVDGATRFGRIIDVGSTASYASPPRIAADPDRRSLTATEWMAEFLNTTSTPVGHGFTPEMIADGFACYSFHPRADLPLKVIVLDDTDKVGCGAAAALDARRFDWLVGELDAGEAADELMIVCSHVPIRPYAVPVADGEPPPASNPLYPLWSMWAPYAEISEETLLAKLHTYRNLVLWCAGHVHRNAITPQPSPDGDPEKGFWEVETSSLRDFPQQLRRFDVVRNGDDTVSVFALNVDVAVDQARRPNGSRSPACTSRSYAIASQQIFANPIRQGPGVDPASGAYNAELVKQLSPRMRARIAAL